MRERVGSPWHLGRLGGGGRLGLARLRRGLGLAAAGPGELRAGWKALGLAMLGWSWGGPRGPAGSGGALGLGQQAKGRQPRLRAVEGVVNGASGLDSP